MTDSGLHELDIARIRMWCQERVPERARHQVRVECEVADHQVIVVERRAPWREDAGPDWTRRPVAQLTYDPSRPRWTLSPCDRHGRFRRTAATTEAASVSELLVALDSDPTRAFWG